ncbi:MAG: hypothetical protein LBU24_05860 [Methanocalculaceae archaeon]|jgi:multiple antibiotic resistance protein|nr:hypothetical protein [Methanocalculaceae archaeon]
MDFIPCLIMLFSVEAALWNLPVFELLTRGLTEKQYSREALIAAGIAFVLMTLTAVVGQQILEFLGLTMEGICIGGGLIILYMGFLMVLGRGFDDTAEMTLGNAGCRFAVPFLFGAGVCGIILAYTAEVGMPQMVAAIVIVSILSFGILRFGTTILRKIGSAINLLMILAGLYITIIGAQSIMRGVMGFLNAGM